MNFYFNDFATNHYLYIDRRSFACKGRVEPVSEYLNLHDSVAYVGKESCMQCHYDIYQSYMQTGMGQSIALSSKEKSASIFDENAVVKDLYSGFLYHPYWDGDTLFLKEFWKHMRELKT